MSIGLALLAVSSLASGYSNMKSAETQSMFESLQGEATKLDYEHKSYLALDAGYRLRQQQAMEYIGAGVEIQGTPLLMLKETARRTEVEAESIKRTGGNLNIVSQMNASSTKNQGRSGMISSIMTAGGYMLSEKAK